MNLLEIAKLHIHHEMQRIFFPLIFLGFGVLGALFPFHTWSPDGHASAPTAAVSYTHLDVYKRQSMDSVIVKRYWISSKQLPEDV